MTKSSIALAVKENTATSSTLTEMVARAEEAAIHEELEETGIMGGWQDTEEDEES